MKTSERTRENPQEYYKSSGPMTAPGAHAAQVSALPRDLAALCEIVQGVLIHGDMAPFLYGITMSDEQRRDMHIRPITEMLTQIRALDAQPLTSARAPGQRLACVCRHFALMLCVILREQGMAARARCGFGAYFTPLVLKSRGKEDIQSD